MLRYFSSSGLSTIRLPRPSDATPAVTLATGVAPPSVSPPVAAAPARDAPSNTLARSEGFCSEYGINNHQVGTTKGHPWTRVISARRRAATRVSHFQHAQHG